MRGRTTVSILFVSLLLVVALSTTARAQSWSTLDSGVDSNLRGISAAKIPATERIVIWASGSNGVILRSLDDGVTWSHLSVPGQPELDFRGIVAFDDKAAYLMSSGAGNKSRIYKTTDGGATWDLQYTDVNNVFFLDSIACSSRTNCFALGDPMNGKFLIVQTTDGQRWNPLPPQNLPTALDKEGAFAASNSNLLVESENELLIVTGGLAARALHTADGGKSWTASPVPVAADNASSGIFAVTIAEDGRLIAVGGDYANPGVALRVAAYSQDHAKTWQSPAKQPAGYRCSVVPLEAETLVTVGITGSDISYDAGLHWTPFSLLALNALFKLDAQHIYAAGPKGTIAQLAAAPDSKQ
jgi:photosystem II stability/assembly factor-like uncharacterized protein